MEVAPDAGYGRFAKDSQDARHIACISCGGEIYNGENVYQWNSDGCDLCEDCFLERVRRLPPGLLADLFGLRHEEVAIK